VEKFGLGSGANCCKSCVTRCHIDGRHFIGAQSDCGSRPDVCAQTHLTGDLHHAAVSDELGHFHGGYVQRIGQRVARADFAHEFFAIIVGRVFRAVILEGRGLVVDGCCGSDDRLNPVDGVIEGCRINERFEDRAGLAVCQGVIELALPVVATADDRFDFSRARIKCHQRNLSLRNRFVASLFGQRAAPFVVSLGQKQVDIFHPCVDRGGRGALKSWI
jgi:hypothetical protein